MKNQRMALNIELEQFLHRVLYGLDARIAEFHHLVAIGTNQMVMLAAAVRPLIQCLILSELMAGHQIRFRKQVKEIGRAHV